MKIPYSKSLQEKEVILQFFKEWIEWAESTDPHDFYSKTEGLCINLEIFCLSNGLEVERYTVYLLDIFSENGFTRGFPFGVADYTERERKSTQHLCPARKVFVKTAIKSLQKQFKFTWKLNNSCDR